MNLQNANKHKGYQPQILWKYISDNTIPYVVPESMRFKVQFPYYRRQLQKSFNSMCHGSIKKPSYSVHIPLIQQTLMYSYLRVRALKIIT